ncbi:unnamed protein product [Polarella glacialis]|uniref:Uncharacterized protein n=1 Tax=Polarella glacialis TaxID=89957 RepID=A0A813JM39_POLGL|nr:unnamed protein product [Polarella glacialis]CAE8682011.1 unnamed protein product [Polarella glacialis]
MVYVEGGTAEPFEPQQNWLTFAAGIPQLGPVSHNLAGTTGWSPGGLRLPQHVFFAPATVIAAVAGSSPGFSQAELEKLASNERWTALPPSYRRAAGEIYKLIRSTGHATVREWFTIAWGDAPETPRRRDLYHSATVCDMQIDEYVAAHGPAGLGWALTHDDMLEGLFRQLSAAREFQLTGDAAATSRILAFSSANESILPPWLQNETRKWSSQVRKQKLRACGPKRHIGDGTSYPKGKAKAKPSVFETPGAANSEHS